MVTDVPDSAYELCTKYAPNCDDTSFASVQQTIKSNESSQSSSLKKSKEKTKSKSNKKNKKSPSKSSNSEITKNLKQNRRQIVSRDSSVELDGGGFGFNGEDEYYDSLNSGNEEGVFGPLTERPVLAFNPVEPTFENEFEEHPEPGIIYENVNLFGIFKTV